MNWAANNPEKYDEIVRMGIRRMLESRFPELDEIDEDISEALDYFIQELQDNFYQGKGLNYLNTQEERYKYHVWNLIEKLSLDNISDAEGDHFAGIVDDAHDRAKDGA